MAQRGRNKQKRHDLRQFGLAQTVTREFLIPVLSEVYEGNETDRQRFLPFLTKVRTKLAEVQLSIEEFTLVFDKGSNTKENFAALDHMKLPYVASLTSAYHEDLIRILLTDYRTVKLGEQEILCCRTRKKVWGKERTIEFSLA